MKLFRRNRRTADTTAVAVAVAVNTGKKLSIVNVKDYPRQLYSAYWEIGVANSAPFQWRARLYDYATGAMLSDASGVADTENDARRESQQWVLDNIETYRRSFS